MCDRLEEACRQLLDKRTLHLQPFLVYRLSPGMELPL